MAAMNDLMRIVRINENIKTVVTQARRINLLALNAILLSRRAGKLALGFGVISDELRTFSKDLTTTMRVLMNLSYGSVAIVSQFQRYSHVNYILQTTEKASQHQLVRQRLAFSNKKLAELETGLNKVYQDLARYIDDAETAGRFGSVIARSLKIEATYGGGFHQILAQFATEFSYYIDSIPGILQQIQGYLKRNSLR